MVGPFDTALAAVDNGLFFDANGDRNYVYWSFIAADGETGGGDLVGPDAPINDRLCIEDEDNVEGPEGYHPCLRRPVGLGSRFAGKARFQRNVCLDGRVLHRPNHPAVPV